MLGKMEWSRKCGFVLTVRAIHLELVKDLSADQFLDCLRRYIG